MPRPRRTASKTPWYADLPTASLAEAERDLRRLLQRVATGPGVLITHRRQPLVVFLSVDAYERLRPRIRRGSAR